MKNNSIYFTAGQFAKLHHINKRTLHYYDEIGLFSPKHKGENNYRYYTYEQSMEIENILALREVGMTIEELKNYVRNPNPQDYLKISNEKINDIDKTILKLKNIKRILTEKEEIINLCNNINDGQIDIVNLDNEYLLMTPLDINFDTLENLHIKMDSIMSHLQKAWEISDYKSNSGSYISLDKIKNKNYDNYDGLFTYVKKQHSSLYKRSKGKYIRAFVIGDWDKIPLIYNQILDFAQKHSLTLTGYAYEMGLNEFLIQSMDEYITQILIKVK